jgi:hypothetical protein
VIGVEIVPEVAGFGQSLVAAHQDKYRCKNVEIVACDAAQFRVPDDLTIAYHAYGFPEKTLDVVLQNLIESIERSPRLVRFIYHWPDPRSRGGARDREVPPVARSVFRSHRDLRELPVGALIRGVWTLGRPGSITDRC